MKKILTIFAAAVAALTLASCNKDDSVYENNTAMGNEVQIEAMMAEDATRADAKYATTENINSFQLGIYNGDTQVANSAFNKPTESGKSWSDGQTYYWTANTYKFFGVAQSTGDNAVAYGSANISKDGITFSARETVANEDLIVACATGSQSSKTTKLNFYHALARVRVAANFTKDDKVKLQAKFVKWELQNVATTGTVTIDGTNVTSQNVVWTPAEAKVNVTDNATPSCYLDASYRNVAGTALGTGNTQENSDKYWVNVIPNATVYATKLIATVDFYNMDGTKVGTRYLTASTDDKAVVKLNYASGFKYESGKAYTYKIDIVNNGGKDSDGDGDDDDLDKFQIEIVNVEVAKWGDAIGGTATFTNKIN